MNRRCAFCRHNNKFWQGSGCNLQDNGEKCHFDPLNGMDLFLALARASGLSSSTSQPEDDLDEFTKVLIRGCREDGMSEEDIEKWLKEI